MNAKLFIQAITKFIFGVLIVGTLLFVPAGTFNYLNGCVFMGLLFIPMFFAGVIMMIKNPDLLKRRLDAKESETEQKQVIGISAVLFILGFIIAGLNYRYSWIVLPNIISIIASVLFLIFYMLYGVVLKENEFLSRTIKVEKKQKVVDTGLYGIVRHPMYSIVTLFFLMMPLVLGSIISFILFLVFPFLLVKRINNEEKVLEKELKGYKAYKKKVKYKMIPYIY